MRNDNFFQKHNIHDQLGGIFDDLPGFIYFIKDTNLRYVAFNQRLITIFDVDKASDIIGKKDADFMPPHLVKQITQDDIEILETGVSILNKVELVPRGNGFVDWSTTTKRQLTDDQGNVCGIVGVTRPFAQGVTSMTRSEELGVAVKAMHLSFRENPPIADLAKSVNLSISSFLRKFKACFNMTPKEYMRHLRVQEACHKIVQTTCTLAEISYDCGFSDQSHFSREFSRIMKESPTSYRARFKVK